MDVAVRLVVYDRDRSGVCAPTGEASPLFGGVFDREAGRYTGATPETALEWPVSPNQYEYCLSDKPRTTGKGGRGGGKSEAASTKACLKLIMLPGEHGLALAPSYDKTRVLWRKMLSRLPSSWLLPGKDGISISRRMITTILGSSITFRSADNPDSTRSMEGSWGLVDEEADVPDEAIDVLWGCLRLSPEPQLFGAGTPKLGEYSARYERMTSDRENCEVFSFPSTKNPFIPLRTFELMKTQLDEKRYKQEVLAEFVDLGDGPKYVFRCFSKKRHDFASIPGPHRWVTAERTKERLNSAGFEFIAGVDANWSYPNYAVIWKILAPSRPGAVDRWVAWDIVQSPGGTHCGHLAEELEQAGYTPRNTCVVPDASVRTDRGNGRKSSAELMRASGFDLYYPKKNKSVTSTIDSMLVKLAPVEGDPTMYIRMPECNELADAMTRAVWDRSGNAVEKEGGFEHIISAARYPVRFFCPPAEVRYDERPAANYS